MNNNEYELLCSLEEIRHKNHIEEIELEAKRKREIETMKFDHDLQLQRIKASEIRKSQMRRNY